MYETETKSTPWSPEEEMAFETAIGKWARTWFSRLERSGASVSMGPETQQMLALMWTAGRDYGRLTQPES